MTPSKCSALVATLLLGLASEALAEGPSDSFPAWSPDGAKIVFSSDRSGDIEIYTLTAEGKELTRLTEVQGRDAHATWSPDGQRIVFQSPRDGSDRRDVDLYTMAPDGSKVRRLTHLDGFAGVPMFSPDGSRIVFQYKPAGDWDSERWQIWTMALDGSDLQQRTRDDADNQVPIFSPDGQHLLYFSNRSGSNQLWRMTADGTGSEQLTSYEGEVNSGTYSPDGQRIAFVWARPAPTHSEPSAEGASRDVYWMAAAGSPPQRITSGRQVWGVPFFSPDGNSLLINAVEDGRFVIDIAQSNGSRARRLTP